MVNCYIIPKIYPLCQQSLWINISLLYINLVPHILLCMCPNCGIKSYFWAVNCMVNFHTLPLHFVLPECCVIFYMKGDCGNISQYKCTTLERIDKGNRMRTHFLAFHFFFSTVYHTSDFEPYFKISKFWTSDR